MRPTVGATAPCPPKGKMDWQARGACRGMDPTLFEEVRRGYKKIDVPRVFQAMMVCQLCPVRRECLAWGIKNRCSGVYGQRYLEKGSVRRWPAK